jgi:hypothetical protein
VYGPLTHQKTIMKSFSPEFAQHWFTGRIDGSDEALSCGRDDDALSPSQQEALEALAERVNAARSTL